MDRRATRMDWIDSVTRLDFSAGTLKDSKGIVADSGAIASSPSGFRRWIPHRRVLRLILPVACAIAGAWLVWPRPRLLLERAIRVPNYQIPPNEVVLHCATTDDDKAILGLLGRLVGSTLTHPLVEVDLETGRARNLGSSVLPDRAWGMTLSALSPDGKWRLYHQGSARVGAKHVLVSSDGHHKRVWEAIRGGGRILWQPDCAGWLDIPRYGGSPTLDFNIDGGQFRKFPHSTGPYYEPLWYWKGTFAFAEPSGTQIGRWVQIEQNGATTRRRSIELPENALIVSAQLSPTADRVLWWLFVPRTTNLVEQVLNKLGLMRSRVTVGHGYGPGDESLWVSRRDGSELREIGRVTSREHLDDVVRVTWARNGKHIAFIYEDGIYTVESD